MDIHQNHLFHRQWDVNYLQHTVRCHGSIWSTFEKLCEGIRRYIDIRYTEEVQGTHIISLSNEPLIIQPLLCSSIIFRVLVPFPSLLVVHTWSTHFVHKIYTLKLKTPIGIGRRKRVLAELIKSVCACSMLHRSMAIHSICTHFIDWFILWFSWNGPNVCPPLSASKPVSFF